MATCNCSELSFSEHPALGSSLVYQAEVILFETTFYSTSFKCGICGKIFSRKDVYNKHKKGVHEKGTSFRCPECGEYFGFKWSLKYHVDSVHKGKSFYFAPVARQMSSNKTEHSQISYGNESPESSVYSGLKPFGCEVCGKDFYRHHHLLQHIAGVHKGERPYSCNVCGMTFKYQCDAKKHVERLHKDRGSEEVQNDTNSALNLPSAETKPELE
ncbi:hypothetical protein ACTXT7_014909 [Hymenolepis weldensis]